MARLDIWTDAINKPPFPTWLNPNCEFNKNKVLDCLFNEGAGGRACDLARDNTGSLINHAAYACRGVRFDGTDDYITIPTTPAFNIDNGSLAVWINNLDTGGGGWFMRGDSYDPGVSSYGLSRVNSDFVFFLISAGTEFTYDYASASLSTINVWNHWVGVWDSTTVKLYKNGVLAQSVSRRYSIPATSEPLIIGGRAHHLGNYTNIVADNPIIVARALSADEVLALYREPYGLEQYLVAGIPIFYSIPSAGIVKFIPEQLGLGRYSGGLYV